ncbi:MAG TPA: CehA/McbA family metallohydrolase [Vicinamibacterales bacterium]|nr:CehA/McbA family metallohydrolase [Vicinamibacterales bacterium]
MKRLRWIVVLVLVLVAGAITCYQSLPPIARAVLSSAALQTPVRGAFHVHSRRSDGTGTVEDIAAAAARAGLKFVILTDHGDASREPAAPAYLQGVLCIDAVEISTDGGHLVALGLPRSPYALGGEARDVVEDVRRLGGMAIAAHPESAKPELRWTDSSAPLDGVEWLNGDSEWRDEPVRTLARALLTYPFRAPETLATFLDRPQEALQRWDRLTTRRPTVAVAAADAHARIGLRGGGDPYEDRLSVHIPGYEQVFRTLSIALPNVTFSANASADARAVLDAIRRGHVFSSIDAVAAPIALDFSASSGSQRAEMGDVLPMSGPLAFHVRTNAPPDASILLMRDGQMVATAAAPGLEYNSTETGVYRIEIHLPGAPGQPPVPLVLSNPVYVRPAGVAGEPVIGPPAPKALDSQYGDGPAQNWRVENSPRSQGALDVVAAVGGTQLSFRYAVGGTLAESPFVALVMSVTAGLSEYDRLTFMARASRPTRVSVQVRVPDGPHGQRWHRSVYLDEAERPITVMFDDLMPRGTTTSQRPVLSSVREVLFVLDTVNTRPGANGQVWIDNVKLGRP